MARIDTYASSRSNPPEPRRSASRPSSSSRIRSRARQSVTLPSTPLTFGFFTARFDPAGTFTLEGEGWPPFKGTWTLDGSAVVLSTPGVRQCEGPGRYRLSVDGGLVHFDLVSDECMPRKMIVNRSTWRPAGTAAPVAARRIVRTAADHPKPLPPAASAAGSWPSFRGPDAAGTTGAQHLPDRWNGSSGENIVWRTDIPGSATRAPSSGASGSSSPAQ